MSEYYGATTTTNDFLAHYGVKGMKWGVRRALASKKHQDIKLARQYKKAMKKLKKYNDAANVSLQKENEAKYRNKARKYSKVGGVGAGIAVSALGGNLLTQKMRPNIYNKFHAERDAAYKEYEKRLAEMGGEDFFKTRYKPIKDVQQRANAIAQDAREAEGRLNNSLATIEKNRERDLVRNNNAEKLTRAMVFGGSGAAMAGAVGSAINHVRANRAHKRTTSEGHKEAIAKRNAWQREMNKAFSGTKYANQVGASRTKKRRNRK